MPEVLSQRCRVKQSKNYRKTPVVQSLKALRPTTAASLKRDSSKCVFLGRLWIFFRAYILKNISNQFTAWKLFKYRGFFWSVFSCICTEYRDLRFASRVQCRSGRPGLFCEEGVLKRFAKSIRKHVTGDLQL